MKEIKHFLIVAVLCAIAINQQLNAQTQNDIGRLIIADRINEVSALPTQDHLASCFRGRPLPACRSFWITEARFGYQLASSSNALGRSWEMDAEVGWMRNLNSRSAIGGGIAFGWDELESEFASLRPRYRRWLTPALAFDGGLGVRWEPGRIEIIEVHLGLNYSSLIGVWTEGVYDFGAGDYRWMSGAKLGSQLGLASYATGILTLAYILFFIFPVD